MNKDRDKIFELDEVSAVKESLPDTLRWARSARLSLRSFLLAIVSLIFGVISIVAAIQISGFNEAFVVIAVISVVVFVIFILICLISGFIAVGRHNFVLWWLIPTLLLVGWCSSFLVNDCM
ncbi:MAG: hypothetical protein KAI74_02805 [Kiritimatiellae bacterium]|nr:hypothetical protein [Kiritimatiellia bacterium]